MKNVTELLKQYGTQNITHTKCTFFEHLVNTGNILKDWECSDSLYYAGYFHSFYGTEGKINQPILTFAERDQLRSEIGEQAEYLVYLYCLSKRKSFYEQIEKIDDFGIINRFNNEKISISKQTLIDLITLDIANLIEEYDRQPLLEWNRQPLLNWLGRFWLKKQYFSGHFKGLTYLPKKAQEVVKIKIGIDVNQYV
jgi:hypothetical protein